MKKSETYKCDACGKTAKLASHKRHWCPCNPGAPFEMTSATVRRVTSKVLTSLRSVAPR